MGYNHRSGDLMFRNEMKRAKRLIAKGLSVESFRKDTKGESNLFKLVIGVFIIAILVGALIPTAINSIMAANQTGWDAGTIATYDSLAILIVVCIVAVLAGLAYKAFND